MGSVLLLISLIKTFSPFPPCFSHQLPAESPTRERSHFDRPKTPLTPSCSKKAFMETLLAPPTLNQDHAYSRERATELFLKGHEDVNVTVRRVG